MSHHFVICSKSPQTSDGMAPLGSRQDIVTKLGGMNTCPEREGDDTLYGPGIRLEMRAGEDPLRQMLLSIVEEEIAWLVIARIAHAMDWRVLDVDTGDEVEFLQEDSIR